MDIFSFMWHDSKNIKLSALFITTIAELWLLFITNQRCVHSEVLQPSLHFIQEPPYRVSFHNSSGTAIPCSAAGTPLPITVTWETYDGTPVTSITGLRTVEPDGMLIFPPFSADKYHQKIHSNTYRCLVSNIVGKIASRDVHVRAVVSQDFEVQVLKSYSLQGNTAILRCNIPSFVKDYVTVISWEQDNLKITADYDNAERYLLFPTGELHVQNVDVKDSFNSYSCITRNTITKEVKQSGKNGKIVVSDDHSKKSPRINHSQALVETNIDNDVILPCAAQGYPPPIYSWFRYSTGFDTRMTPVIFGNRISNLGGSLLLRKVTVEDSGKYVCLVNNSSGHEKAEVELIIRENLHINVTPAIHTVNVGGTAIFQCKISGKPVTFIKWQKNHQQLPHANNRVRFLSRDVLEIRHVQREDKGYYQCFVYNDQDCAQGTAELRLGDITPTLKEVFRSVTVEPGSMVSLTCTASANPLPEVRWTLDEHPVPTHLRFSVGDFVTSRAEVISFVNVTHIRVEDGGYYKCQASNDVGSVFNREKINVIGPPFVRQMENMTVVEGETFNVRCPVAGYPVKEISWQHSGRRIPYNHRQRLFSNGTLIIKDVDKRSDGGQYSCVARSPNGQSSRSKMYLDVLIPPVIEPIFIPTGLEEGSRSKILCSVTKGDTPIRISWLKDGKPVPSYLQVKESVIDEYSSFLTFPRLLPKHAGNYTCVAENEAGCINYTASMVIYAPPRWISEPTETSVISNNDVIINCQAKGFPQPVISWKKSTGSLSSDYVTLRTNAHINVMANGSLAIRKVEKSDEGFYMCQAANEMESGLSTVIRLHVKVPAYFTNKFKAETIQKGKLLCITCKMFGDHPLRVQWKKDGKHLDLRFNRRYDITRTLTDDGMSSQLQVQSADRRDSSLYTCVGSNSYGKDEMNIQVMVQEPPDRPSRIIVERVESRKVALSWSTPYSGNSDITRYILVYWQQTELNHHSRKEIVIEASKNEMTVKGLLPVTTYHFQLQAENIMGLSAFSDDIKATTDQEVPGGSPQEVKAEAVGSQIVNISWKPPEKHLTYGPITGYYVGYKIHGSAISYTYKTVNMYELKGELAYLLTTPRRSTKYSIILKAFNSKGSGPPSEEVLVLTLDKNPPSAPKLSVTSVTFSSIQVTWTLQTAKNTPVSGFIIKHRRGKEEWLITRLLRNTHIHTYYGLNCGTRYKFFILAFNDIGKSPPSDTVEAKTKGSVPSSPIQHAFICVNVTSATLYFTEWDSGSCPVSFFVVKYKPETTQDWIIINDRIFPRQSTYKINNLTPNTCYELRVIAHNDAGSTHVDYSFVTLPIPAQPSSTVRISSVPFYTNLSTIVPLAVTCVILVTVIVVIWSITWRKHGRRYHQDSENTRRQQKEVISEPVPMTEVKNKSVTEPTYHTTKEELCYPSLYSTSRVPVCEDHSSGDSSTEGCSLSDSMIIYDIPFVVRQPSYSTRLNNRDRRNVQSHDIGHLYSFSGGRPISQILFQDHRSHLSSPWSEQNIDDILTVNLPHGKTLSTARWCSNSQQCSGNDKFYLHGYKMQPEVETRYCYSTRIPNLTYDEEDSDTECDRDQFLDYYPGLLEKCEVPYHVAFRKPTLFSLPTNDL
ncbi:cell adhesion molecule Dscam1-like [Tachypleus tridentatus]|uniref:cell adhesion molecule Dscam1-like n=1 Tax=Tachypleus tridentatus TaxID=6853 RepID=UPI003FD53431